VPTRLSAALMRVMAKTLRANQEERHQAETGIVPNGSPGSPQNIDRRQAVLDPCNHTTLKDSP
jgi:hypothetical protein